MSSNAVSPHYDGAVFALKKDGSWTTNPPLTWSEMTLQQKAFFVAMQLLKIILPIVVFIALVSAMPNRKWASIRHPDWEGRHDVSIGAWGMCSEHYKSDMAWATKPYYSHCTQAELDGCFAVAMPECTNTSHADYSNFADKDWAKKKYEAAWTACRPKCSTRKWEERCYALGCQGSKHRDQCFNVTLVEKGLSMAKLTYKPRTSSPGLAWSKSDNDCRPISDICDNHKTLGHVGNLGWAGFAFATIGVGCLLVFIVQIQTIPVFLASLASFFMSWLLVLISWSVFAAELRKEVTCTVVDSVAWGCGLAATSTSMCAVQATGKYGDLIDPSNTFGVVVGCWILLSFIIIFMCLYLKILLKKPEIETSQI